MDSPSSLSSSFFFFFLLLLLLLSPPSSAQLGRPLCSDHVHQKIYFLDNFDPLSVFGIAAPTWANIDVIFRKNESQAFAVITTSSPSDEISLKTEFRFSTDGPLQRFLEIYHVSSINSTQNDSFPTSSPSSSPSSPQAEPPKELDSSAFPLSSSSSPFLVTLATIVALKAMTSFSDALVVGAGALVALGMARAQEEVAENCTVSITLELTAPSLDYAQIYHAVRGGFWTINNAASVTFLDDLDPAIFNQTNPTPFPPTTGALIGPKCHDFQGACVESSICSLIQGSSPSSPSPSPSSSPSSSCPYDFSRPTTVCCTKDDPNYVIDSPTILGESCSSQPAELLSGDESGCVLEEVCQIAGGKWQPTICQQFGHVCCFGNGIHVVRPG